MKRLASLMLLALALPIAALANSVDFTNSHGSLSGSSAGLSLSGSTLTAAKGPGGLITGDLGSLTFSTGALSTGNLQAGATFAGGGSFVITANGTGSIPNVVIFSGSFSGPVTWALIPLSNGTHNYTLTGSTARTVVWFDQFDLDPGTRKRDHVSYRLKCHNHPSVDAEEIRGINHAFQWRHQYDGERAETNNNDPRAKFDDLLRHWPC